MDEKPVIGIDVGATNIKSALIYKNGTSIGLKVQRTSPTGAQAVLYQVKSLIENHLLEFKDISGIGIGTIGVIDPLSGSIISSTKNIEGWKGFPLKSKLQAYFDIPIKIENDVHLVALGEYHYGNHHFLNNNMACIVLGTGVGIGIIHQGYLFKQAHELGHMVVKFGGRKCSSCGRSGCLEAYCSGKGIKKYYQELCNDHGLYFSAAPDVQEIFNRSNVKNTIESAIAQDFIQALSCAIANTILAFSISDFVISGGLSACFSSFQHQLTAYSKAQTMSDIGNRIVIKKGSLNEYAGVFGAASLFFYDKNPEPSFTIIN